MRPDLSLVIPAYNEARRLAPTIDALVRFCAELDVSFEVLLIVERSTDDTLILAQELTAPHRFFTVIDNGVQRGKGHAVRSGMLRAKGVCIFYMDADLSVPLREVHNFMAHFAAHPEVDVIVGNRQHSRSRITRRQSLLRRKLGELFNLFLQLFGMATLYDTQCGFKAFRGAAANAVFVRQSIDGFAFDVEVLLLARQLGLTVADLPVEWVNSPESHVHLLRDSIAMLRDTIRLRRRLRPG